MSFYEMFRPLAPYRNSSSHGDICLYTSMYRGGGTFTSGMDLLRVDLFPAEQFNYFSKTGTAALEGLGTCRVAHQE